MTIARDITLDKGNVDFSLLVGREVLLITEQFPGKVLRTRVIGVKGNNLIIDRSGSGGLINQLICRQHIEVHFLYKDQPMVFHSVVSIPREGKIEIPIADDLNPKVRRKFVRYDYGREIKLTYFDMAHIKTARLNKLKWMETGTLNIGGGGMLIEIPTVLTRENYVIFNLGLEEIGLPKLMVGRVRHCQRDGRAGVRAGVEFLIKEELGETVPAFLMKSLSDILIQFDAIKRMELTRYFEEKYRNKLI